MRKLIVIAAILLVGVAVFADDDDTPAPPPLPQSAAAKDALRKYAAGEKRARQEYDHTKIGLQRDLTAELQRAKQIALRNTDLDEANRIQANLDAIKNDAVPTAAAMTPIARVIVGSTWRVDRWNQTMTYRADGTCIYSGGQNGRWQVAGDNSIAQLQSNGAKTLITFTPDRKAAIWQESSSDGGTALSTAERIKNPN